MNAPNLGKHFALPVVGIRSKALCELRSFRSFWRWYRSGRKIALQKIPFFQVGQPAFPTCPLRKQGNVAACALQLATRLPVVTAHRPKTGNGNRTRLSYRVTPTPDKNGGSAAPASKRRHARRTRSRGKEHGQSPRLISCLPAWHEAAGDACSDPRPGAPTRCFCLCPCAKPPSPSAPQSKLPPDRRIG